MRFHGSPCALIRGITCKREQLKALISLEVDDDILFASP